MSFVTGAAKNLAKAGARPISTSVARHAIHNNITETIGRTPVVKINRLAPAGIDLYAKLEYFNPLSSVKDRLAIAIIEHGERTGKIKPGSTIIEATSGNTGIALAMVCAQRGYKFVATMAASFSIERRKVMRALGASVIITPAPLGGTGMVKKAEELAEKHGWHLARQFETEANADYHAQTTGPEILSDFAGKRLDYWVTGYGTGGTFAGAGRVIKQARPDTQIVLSEPKAAPLLTSGIPQPRKEVLGQFGAPESGHPSWTPHPIQGWTPNFIPYVLEQGLEKKLHAEVLTVDGNEAMSTALALAKHEGIFTGTSGGATMATALEVCKKAPQGSTVLCMIPDTADRYLSTPLFGAIDVEMDEAEVAICNSTPLGAAE